MNAGERARTAVIQFLAEQLRRAKYLHDEHQPDELGHCSGCHTQVRATPWPCVIRQMADDCISLQIPLQRRAS
jgi:hypothetical protein